MVFTHFARAKCANYGNIEPDHDEIILAGPAGMIGWWKYAQLIYHYQWLTESQSPAVANGSLEAFPVDRLLFLSS